MLWASSWSRWSIDCGPAAAGRSSGTAFASDAARASENGRLGVRRCISGALTFGWKILYLHRTIEEIIFSFWRLDDRYIENNFSQPRDGGSGVSHAVSACLPRSEDRTTGSGWQR